MVTPESTVPTTSQDGQNSFHRTQGEIDSQERATDVYDLAAKLVQVHGPDGNYISSDFVLSNPDDDTSSNKTVRFIVEQIKICKFIIDLVPNKPIAKEMVDFLMTDVRVPTVLSRARGGQITHEILKALGEKARVELENSSETNHIQAKDKQLEEKTENL